MMSLWKSTSQSMNVQYDSYKNTKYVLKMVWHKNPKNSSTSFHPKTLCDYFRLKSLSDSTQLWSSAQGSLPKNIFNFTVQYLNNTLANHTHLHKWKLSSSPGCSFCLKPGSLLHIIAGSKSYLEDGQY